MDKPLDLRIQKTHAALISAFQELLKKKHFEKITVQEICELAMVRRATFYKHFADKYELFAFTVRSTIGTYQLQRLSEDKSDIPGYYTGIIQDTFDFIEQNDKLVRSVMGSEVLDILLNILSEQIVIALKDSFYEHRKTDTELLASPEIMAQAFTGALISIAKWWITTKRTTPKEEVVKYGMIVFQRLMVDRSHV